MDWSFLGNPVVIAVAGLLVLSLVRLNVVFALMLAAFLGGMAARMAPTDVVNAFLRTHPEFSPEPLALPEVFPKNETGMLTLIPGEYDTDGFFICRLRRKL